MSDRHPRPQLVRDGFRELHGTWSFRVDEVDEGLSARWFDDPTLLDHKIEVPFPPESRASGVDCDVASPIWYHRAFDHPVGEAERLLLHFEGSDYQTMVWLNGAFIGEHEGGHSAFSFDVTRDVRHGSNDLVVRVVDSRELDQPRGKQDWRSEPHAIWYRRTSGIWRTVWLETVPETYIEQLTIGTTADFGSVVVTARLGGPVPEHTDLAVEVTLAGQTLGRASVACFGREVEATVPLTHPSLDAEPEELWWTPERPTLLDLELRLSAGASGPVDRVFSYCGLRTISCDGGEVLLNGRPYFLRLVLEQGTGQITTSPPPPWRPWRTRRGSSRRSASTVSACTRPAPTRGSSSVATVSVSSSSRTCRRPIASRRRRWRGRLRS